MNKIDIIQPTPQRACECSCNTCTYCKYEAPHPSPDPLDWSSEDWEGEKAKAKEQKSLIDFMPSKPDSDQQMMDVTIDKDETVMTDDTLFQRLTIQSDNPTEETPEVTDMLMPLLEVSAETPVAENLATDIAKTDDSMETHYEILTEQELRLQRKEEKYAIHISMLSEEEESNMETNTDEATYSYFN